jgi:hypothetical protein
MTYESTYQRAPVGKIEIKTLPAARAIAAKMEPRRENMDSSFTQIFRFIQTNAIPMTIPVEGDHESHGAMRLFIGTSLTNRTLGKHPVGCRRRTVRRVLEQPVRPLFPEEVGGPCTRPQGRAELTRQ